MKLEERSPEAQSGRSAETLFPKPRCSDISLRTHFKEEILPIRRKQAAKSTRYASQSGNSRDLEVARADHEYNESSFPFRQRTNSSTSFDTIPIRSTATKLKNDTGAVAARKSAPRNSTPISFKKQKPSFQSISTQSKSTSSLSLSTANAKALRKKRLKKSGNGPVPKPLPTIFNVGQASLLSGLLVALPSTTISTTTTHSLDDIFSWNMHTLPSIPSPPHSPLTRSNISTTASSNMLYSAPSDAPFSTPYDEDALFENEIPFPFNKHSGVIIENMGVKKAKNLNKGKESLLNRHITTVRPDLYPHSIPTLPPSLRSFSRNTTDLDPLDHPQPDIPHTTTPRISVASSSSTEDAWRSIHVGPADCELSIAFPQTSHFEAWDMDDEAFFACPLFLCLMAKDPDRWTGTPIALPDFSLIDIRCDDLPVPSSMSVYDPSVEYAVQCTVPWNRSLPPPYASSKNAEFPFIVDHKEINIEGMWERTYTKPKMEGQTPIFHIADRNGDVDGTRNARGWYLKIWIPIPARLFLKRETRIFEVRASVWMTRVEEQVLNMMDSEKEEEDFPLIAEAEMTVSHLRRQREMMS